MKLFTRPLNLSLLICCFSMTLFTGCEETSTSNNSNSADSTSAKAKEPAPHEEVSITKSGIDVSNYQPDINWEEVKGAGVEFVFIKATEGEADSENELFTTQWEGAKAAGITRGAYHYFLARDKGIDQANYFISKVDLEPGDLAPVVDIEVLDGQTIVDLEKELKVFMEAIEAHYGIKPILYSYPSFLDTDIEHGFGQYPLWLASYTTEAPSVPKQWSKYLIWQYTGEGDVAGITGNVDQDRFKGRESEWESLIVSQKQ